MPVKSLSVFFNYYSMAIDVNVVATHIVVITTVCPVTTTSVAAMHVSLEYTEDFCKGHNQYDGKRRDWRNIMRLGERHGYTMI